MNRISALQVAVGAWADRTFGSPNRRGSSPAIKHLATEVVELAQVAALPSAREEFLEEYADCLMLLLDAARRDNLYADEVVEAGFKKLRTNEERGWEKGYSEHVVEPPWSGWSERGWDGFDPNPWVPDPRDTAVKIVDELYDVYGKICLGTPLTIQELQVFDRLFSDYFSGKAAVVPAVQERASLLDEGD